MLQILQMLSLGVLMDTTKQCELKETDRYYIYNTTVNISTYHCFYSAGPDFKCNNYGRKVTNPNILSKCRKLRKSNISANDPSIFDSTYYEQVETAACKSLTQAKLLEDKVISAENKEYRYSTGNFVDTSGYILWFPNLCDDLHRIYIGKFEVYTTEDDHVKYIRNRNSSLKLIKAKEQLCGLDIWSTNYDDVIVFSQYIATSSFSDSSPNFQSSLDKDCVIGVTSKIKIVTSEGELQLTSKPEVGVTEKLYSRKEDATSLEMAVLDEEENIEELKKSVYYLLIFIVVCCLWYIFDVLVNCSSLRMVSKTRTTNDRAYIINCVSQSLTNRYIFLVPKGNEKSELVDMSNVQESNVYETVDDKL